MRVSLFAIAGGVGFAYAQSQLPGVPPCAEPCVAKFTSGSSIAGCNSLDVGCICANQSFISNIACCLLSVCDEADQQAATAYADSICKANGVIVPTAVSCTSSLISSTSSTPSSTPSSAASSTGTAAQVTTSPTTSSTPSSTVSPTSSSTSPAATKNAGTQNVAGLGAGIFGGLAAAAALL